MSSWPSFDGLEVVEHLSTETVAEVYAANQPLLGRRVEVKALRANVLPSSPFAAALRREAEILADLSHPGIQQVFEFHCDAERMWLVLEHVKGWSLKDLIQRAQKLTPMAAAAVGVMVAGALAHCHERGIVHRNIQPRNVVVNAEGRVTLIGFVGAVKERLPTAPELLDGTVHAAVSTYLSPEHVLGETTDGRSDLFSLGTVLYESVTGRQPFGGPDERTVAQRIRQDAPGPPSRFAPQIPNAFERCILRCLEKLPSDRFGSAAELEHALQAVVSHDSDLTPQRYLQVEMERLSPLTNTSLSLAPIAFGTNSARRSDPSLRAAVGLVLATAAIALGALVIERGQRQDGPLPRRGTGQLGLTPENAGYLRVVVEPWAKVRIDGQPFDTTPFARPIPLPPGLHYLHFEHPRAPVERREVRVSAGETILVDVEMKVTPMPTRPSRGGGNSSDSDRDGSP